MKLFGDAAGLRVEGLGGLGVVERVLGIDTEWNGIVSGSEVMTVSLVPVFAGSHGDELREFFVERTESVVDPGAEGWEVAIVLMSSGVELGLGTVVAIGGPHGANDGEFIDLFTEAGEPIADFDAANAILSEADLQGIEGIALIAIGVWDDESFDGEFVGILDGGEGCFRDGLSGVAIEHGFGVEALHVA